MSIRRIVFTLILSSSLTSGFAQQLSIGSKRVSYSYAKLLFLSNVYTSIDAFVGLQGERGNWLVALDLAFTDRHRPYQSYYYDYTDKELSHTSVSAGVFGRLYLYRGNLRLYVEPGIYLNYLEQEALILIPYAYDVYRENLDYEGVFPSYHLGFGVVWYSDENWEFGTHFQLGWIEESIETRDPHKILIASNLNFKNQKAFYVSPLFVRYTFSR